MSDKLQGDCPDARWQDLLERERAHNDEIMRLTSALASVEIRNKALTEALSGAVSTLDDRCTLKDSWGYVECVVCCVQWYGAEHVVGHKDDCPIRKAKAALTQPQRKQTDE